MKQRKGLLGFYNYTVVLTYIGMVFGFIGIVSVLDGNHHNAVFCLMMAGLCDMFDGAVAATRERTVPEKQFGIQIDSLSDLICFGVLPALIVFSFAEKTRISLIAAALYVLCALVRLAYFNVDEQQRQEETTESRKEYFGMPVTTSALIIPFVYLFCGLLQQDFRHISLIVLITMAAMFLLPFRMKKPQLPGKLCMTVLGLAEFAALLLTRGNF